MKNNVPNRLTFICDVGRAKSYDRLWKCRCSCGNEIVVLKHNFLSDNTKSCGCLHKENALKPKKHGWAREKKSPEYKSWSGAKYRCHTPTSPRFKYYGARGIIMCERWRNSFENFLADMGPRPEPKRLYSLERINNDGNYEKDNCVWATRKQQLKNKRPYVCPNCGHKLEVAQ